MKLVKLIVISLLFVSCLPAKYADLPDGLYADLETNKGDILLKLEFEVTPITVANFVSLAEGTNPFVTDSLKGKNYYDGTVFHRVISNFMIQGGDPLGTGNGHPGYKFADEFQTNKEGELYLKHNEAGILSMANSGPNTNGSQFFITHNATPWLDNLHTVFGHVVKGQAVVDSIVQNDTLKTVKIVKIGSDAKSFKAKRVFSNYYNAVLAKKLENEAKVTAATEATMKKINSNLTAATELPSGLKITITETKNGEKPRVGNDINVNYAGYFADGKLFDTNYVEIAKAYDAFNEKRYLNNGYAPFLVVYGPEAPLITGFSEGLQQMKIGDKAMLFIPSHLGYGVQGARGLIPPNTDLVFEVEIVDISK
jgi:cyclophilin family peptidyl-prolyl cis-trans isomerase